MIPYKRVIVCSGSKIKQSAVKSVFSNKEVTWEVNDDYKGASQPIGLEEIEDCCLERFPSFLLGDTLYVSIENGLICKNGTYSDVLVIKLRYPGDMIKTGTAFCMNVPERAGKLAVKSRGRKTWASFLFEGKDLKDPHAKLTMKPRQAYIEACLRKMVVEQFQWSHGRKNDVTFYSFEHVYNDKWCYNVLMDHLAYDVVGEECMPDIVYGLDARGLHLAAGVAARLKCGYGHIRKSGKMFRPVASKEYQKEYGTDKIEMYRLPKKAKCVAIIDDICATGGTLKAAYDMVHGQKVGIDIHSFVLAKLTLFSKTPDVGKNNLVHIYEL